MTTSIPQQYQSLKTKLETIVKKIISPSAIGENEDLNDYTEVGMYYCKDNAISQTLTNNPTSVAFSLLVEKNGVGDGVKQTYTTYNTNNHRTYVRIMYTDDWTDPSNPTNVWGSWQLYFQDTGWKDVTFKSGFSHYSDSNNYRARYRRVGKVVELRGSIKSTKQLTANTDYVMATISDTTCRPDGWITYVQQGSGINRLLITINANGEIIVNRYGTTAYSAIPSGTWINIHTTFLVD